MPTVIGNYGGAGNIKPAWGGSSSSGFSISGSAISAGGAIANAAISAYASNNRAKHEARMAEMNFEHNKAMVLENLKVNQYIVSKNKLEMLDNSKAVSMDIDSAALQAKAEATVLQAAYGMKGGSAQQVQHSIAREAAKAQSKNILELDANLSANKMQLFNAESQAQSVTGIRPIESYNSGLAVASGLTEAFSSLSNIYGG